MTKKGELIKSAGGVVYKTSKNKIYVLLLKNNEGWFLPKGKLEVGEKPEDAVIRELSEELGINKSDILLKSNCICETMYITHQPADIYYPNAKLVKFYLVNIKTAKLHPQSSENIEKARWFEINNAIKKVRYSTYKVVIWKALKMLNSVQTNINVLVIAAGGSGIRVSDYFKQIDFKKPKFLFPIKDKLGTLDILIRMAINCGFEKIYILAKHDKSILKSYISKTYIDKRVEIIETNENNHFGVGYELFKLRNKLDSNFVYTDGNILYEERILKYVCQNDSVKQSLVSVVASSQDHAPTHLKIIGEDLSNVITVENRLNRYLKQHKTKTNMFCSLGLLIFDSHIFDILPEVKLIKDVDLLSERLFKTRLDTTLDLVKFIKYDGWWFAFHSEKDLHNLDLQL